MRRRALAREVLATTWATKIPSLLICLVVAAMCFTAIATVGRSAAASAEVADRLEQAGARQLTVVDTKISGFINERTSAAVRGLSTVQSVDALAAPFDAVNGVIGAGARRLPVWPVLGDVANVGTLVWGRAPQPGEALISIQALGAANLEVPAGYLTATSTGTQYPIVGAFRPKAPFDDLAAGAVVVPTTPLPGRELRVLVDTVASARSTTTAVLGILAPPGSADGVHVESPVTLAETARDINAQLTGSGRALLLLILAVGGCFVAAVVLADVLVRRRDLGRRRTLGITRADLISLVAGRAVLTSAIGALLGCTAGWFTNHGLGVATPLDFVAGVGVLATLASGLAAVVPAVYAATRDPVAVMRTP